MDPIENKMANTDQNKKKPRKTNISAALIPYKDPVNHRWEIGIDEAGRGPLYGRLYVAAVVVPKPPDLIYTNTNTHSFHYDWLKDSKKFTSEKKITEVSEYIRANVPFWTIKSAEPQLIDEINIRQATLRLMRECCVDIIYRIQEIDPKVDLAKDIYLLVDGNDFPIFTIFDESRGESVPIQNETVEQGDNTFCAIAAASILAKVARDQYIYEICDADPSLDERYGFRKNKGYGTKKHMEGLREYGPTEQHRKSFKVKSL